MDDVIGPVNGKAGSVVLHNQGEAIDAFRVFWDRYHKSEGVGWLDDTATAARAMAKALEEFADAVDDAIELLWTEIGIGSAVIAAGVGLAVFTFGASAAASAAATATIIEVAAGLGVTVSTTVATIAATTLTGIAFGAVEGITVDLAVAQPLRMATGLQNGLSLDSLEQAGIYGGAFGGAFGGAAGVTRAAGEVGGFSNLFGQNIPIGIVNPNLAPIGRTPLVLDDMGKRRTWDLFRSENSKVHVPPKVPGDHALITHGATAGSEDRLGQLGADGWTELVHDIGVLAARGREQWPGVPLVLLAHSLGSFATQQFLPDGSDQVDAVALTGTSLLDLLEPALDLDSDVDLSAFNAGISPARNGFDWLSRDDGTVDAYLGDPYCGFGLDVEGMKAMFAGARPLADPEHLAKVRSDLPLYVAVGAQDPVGGQGALAPVLVDRHREAGLTDVTLRVYEGARHEILNETNRDEVVADLLSWLDRATPAAG